MKLNRVGFVGWRGMVGSVLLERMQQEDDFDLIESPTFFTTSQAGRPGPNIGRETSPLIDAHDLDRLTQQDVIVTCQGGTYTGIIHQLLRKQGWQGYWIDAAKTLRMNEQSTIILDPVNMPVIQRALAQGKKDFIGGNCTVSLMIMALDGLLNTDLIEWISVATYQAASGAGANAMRELIRQMGAIHDQSTALLNQSTRSILEIDANVTNSMRGGLPTQHISHTLAGSLLPWIDHDLDNGMSLEEHKGSIEANKILGQNQANVIPIESICVRIGTMRCHGQALTIKLKQDKSVKQIAEILDGANDWVSVIKNTKTESLDKLTPTAVAGTLDIPIGRIRKLGMDGHYISAFTVGDQLFWGAAEPLRRMLRILHAFE